MMTRWSSGLRSLNLGRSRPMWPMENCKLTASKFGPVGVPAAGWPGAGIAWVAGATVVDHPARAPPIRWPEPPLRMGQMDPRSLRGGEARAALEAGMMVRLQIVARPRVLMDRRIGARLVPGRAR